MKGFLAKKQKEAVYDEWQFSKPISDGSKKELGKAGLEVKTFHDKNGNSHDYIYRPPKNGSKEVNTFFGGTDLDFNHPDYLSFTTKLLKSNEDAGLLVPIYPGFNTKTPELPSEAKIKESCQATLLHIASELPEAKFNLIGFSLGAAVAADMATKPNIKSDNLVLIAAPANIRDYSFEISIPRALQPAMGWVKKNFPEKYDTVSAIKQIPKSTNITLITSSADQFTTTKNASGQSHTDRIVAAATESGKTFKLLKQEDKDSDHFKILNKRSTRIAIEDIIKPKVPTTDKVVEGNHVQRLREKSQQKGSQISM